MDFWLFDTETLAEWLPRRDCSGPPLRPATRTHQDREVKAICVATMSVKACVCGENLDQNTMASTHGSIHNRYPAIIDP